jgi:hypothetical protein
MRLKAHSIRISVKGSSSILAFESTGNEYWKVWDRFLTVEGKPAYHIGNVCGTCSFFFERLEGAHKSISPSEVSENFRQGLKNIDDSLLDKIKLILPNGDYVVSLLEVKPSKVSLGSDSDYFSNEQIELWGIDEFWNLPHHPKIEYYRSTTKDLGGKRKLFEFIVPMYPESWLNAEEVQMYKARIESGQKPTALALSVLDIKQPANWEGEPDVTEHWCLSHYLIDGHHKMFAASVENKSITVLSFLALKESIATEENIITLLDLR